MINQQLTDFIKLQLQKGLDKENITKELLANGWSVLDIEEGFNVINVPSSGSLNIPRPPYFSSVSPIQNQVQPKGSKMKILLTVLIFFVLVCGTLAYFFKNRLKSLPVVKDFFSSENVVLEKIPLTEMKSLNEIKDANNVCVVKITETLSDENLAKLFTFYYTNPQPELIIPLINSFISTQKFEDSKMRKPYATFFTEIFRQNPKELDNWIMNDLCGLDEYNTHTWDVLTSALRMSDTNEGKEVLSKIRGKVTSSGERYIDSLLSVVINESNDIRKMKVTSGNGLDTMWAGFFASGDKRYVEQIISTLIYLDTSKYSKETNGGKVLEESFIVAAAAEWSLTNNAKQHLRVMEILKEKEKNETDLWLKKELKKIIFDASTSK